MRLFFQLNWKSIHLQVKGRRKKNSCRHDRKQGGGGSPSPARNKKNFNNRKRIRIHST